MPRNENDRFETPPEVKAPGRFAFIHLTASILTPLALLDSVVYTLMYRAVGLWGRYLSPILAILFFFCGYALMCFEEKLFHYPRTNFHLDDGIGGEEKKYVKKPGEDLNSILTGIVQPKGRVHIEFCPQITTDDLSIYNSCTNNEYHKKVAELIDSRINAGFKLTPNNYIAHDL